MRTGGEGWVGGGGVMVPVLGEDPLGRRGRDGEALGAGALMIGATRGPGCSLRGWIMVVVHLRNVCAGRGGGIFWLGRKLDQMR